MSRIVAILAAVTLGLAVGSPAAAKTEAKKAAPVLRCAHSYADAMAEAKDRGCVVFATFHEDGWHFCEEQHRSVFVSSEFIQWANENVVFLVGYKGRNHKVDPPADGEKAKAKPNECTLYAGITCDEHEKIMADATDGKGGPKLEVKGYPTSYMITPDGKTFEAHKADRAVKSLEDGVDAFAKKAKLHPSAKYQTYLTALENGDKAIADGKWKAAVTAYMTVDAVAKKMPSLGARLSPKIEALNDAVVEAFGKAKDDAATDLVAKIKAIKALRSDVAPKFASAGNLAVLADIDAWIKANPPPAPTPPAKK